MRGLTLMALTVGLLGGCESPDESDAADSGQDTSPEIGDDGSETGDDAATDGATGIDPGPVTLIAEELEVVEDRFCDLDGDGTLDNAIADLGSPASTTFLMALNTAIVGEVEDAPQRFLVHAPWVEDRGEMTDVDLTVCSFEGLDGDSPPNREDDFSGTEAFRPSLSSIDSCGEPLHIFGDASITEGELLARNGTVPIPSVAVARGASFSGTIEPRGRAGSLELCGYLLIGELGRGGGFPNTGDLNTLEVMLAGGAAYGIPGVAGLSPDVDVDGDGLERIELDGDNHVRSCIDGDLSEITGADCWMDPRMADGFALNMRFSAVSATVAPPGPLLPVMVEALCPSGTPEYSLWQSCARADDAACTSGEARPCSTTCGSEGVERCLWDCSDWGPCRGADVLRTTLESCDGGRFEGLASCGGEPPVAQVVDGGRGAGAVLFSEPVVVASGRVSVEAHVSAWTGEAERIPGDGWAIFAYRGTSDEVLGAGGGNLGIDHSRLGYAMEWRFLDPRIPGWDDGDFVTIRAMQGAGVEWMNVAPECAVTCRQPGEPPLDLGAVGPTEQGMRLVVEPDDPATPWNDMLVTGMTLAEEGATWAGIGCEGEGCPVQIVPGDVLQIGISAASGGARSIVSASLPDGLAVDVGVVCP